jgi:DNA polymerase
MVDSLAKLKAKAATCTNCPLYQKATQTVFGAGSSKARLMLVGEQPGDEEDKRGEPFVGPAGRLLRSAMDDAGIDIQDTYLTNAVKHFKWKPGGGWRRLHQKPNRHEINACHPWLEAELEALKPALIVGLGATACQAMFGPSIRVTADRGKVLDFAGYPVFVTVHPSSILRARDAREDEYQEFVADLTAAAKIVA